MISDTPHSKASAHIFKGIDVAKFIMALLVMEIHLQATSVLPAAIGEWCVKPLLTLPVPTFFLISSFLFFKKVHSAPHPWSALANFLKRLFLLYGFWIVVWAPYAIAKKPYYFSGIEGIGSFLTDFFLGAVFGNSWFFGALIVCTTIIFLLSRCVSDKVWWIFPAIVFAYFRLVPILPPDDIAPVAWYSQHIISPYLSFPYNLFWISMGYYLSKPKLIAWIKRADTPWRWSFAILCIAALDLVNVNETIGFTCSIIMLPLAVATTFTAFYHWQPSISNSVSKWLRNSSIIIYVLHGNIEKIFRIYLHFEHGPLLYMLILVICLFLAALIIHLSQKRGFQWLRWAY